MKKILACIIFNIIVLNAVAQVYGDKEKEMFNKARQRDQQATDEAVNGWWAASMKTHEQRIQWWREAKFGMFIHWGIYSLPGGEWKGKKVNGYAEHLMRKEKISRKEYLDIAHQFNPVKFNAEEWILHAKKAGMKYFIIIVDRDYPASTMELYRFNQAVSTDLNGTTIITRELENINLSPGSYTLRIKPADIVKAELMKLLEI